MAPIFDVSDLAESVIVYETPPKYSQVGVALSSVLDDGQNTIVPAPRALPAISRLHLGAVGDHSRSMALRALILK
jgi:hypothetical protein